MVAQHDDARQGPSGAHSWRPTVLAIDFISGPLMGYSTQAPIELFIVTPTATRNLPLFPNVSPAKSQKRPPPALQRMGSRIHVVHSLTSELASRAGKFTQKATSSALSPSPSPATLFSEHPWTLQDDGGCCCNSMLVLDRA